MEWTAVHLGTEPPPDLVAAVEQLGTAKGFDPRRLKLFFGQHLWEYAHYLTRPGYRDEVCERVLLPFAEGDVDVVLTHGLGSLVAYETLHRCDARVGLWLSFATPLALKWVRAKLNPRVSGRGAKPDCVDTWVNVACTGDPLAVPGNQDHFDIDDEVSWDDVEPYRDFHAADFYIVEAAVSRRIAEALKTKASPPNASPTGEDVKRLEHHVIERGFGKSVIGGVLDEIELPDREVNFDQAIAAVWTDVFELLGWGRVERGHVKLAQALHDRFPDDQFLRTFPGVRTRRNPSG